jgi:hypothetical protein
MRKRALFMVFAVALVAGTTLSQTPTTKQQISDLLSALHAANWFDRASAYEQLRRDPEALRQPEVKSALLDLEDRENQTDWSKEPGFDRRKSESRAEYRAELGDTVDSFVDWNDPYQLCIIAHTSYNTDSAFARRLAMAGQAVIPCLMQMAQSASFNDRYKAVAVLVQLRARDGKLSPEMSEKIMQVTIAALHDANENVRVFTVFTLRDFGGQDIIPALQAVAQTDPAPEVNGNSIRKLAATAIAAIQKRTDK